MLAVVAATSAVIVRLNADESREVEYDASVAEQYAEGKLDEFNETPESTNSTRFSFLVGYLLELVFALFVFYFVTSTVFFSGILGCGRLPVLGGRPYEMRQAATNVNNDDRQSEDEEDAQGLQAYI